MNDQQKNRIKLAEAMGWKLISNYTGSFADKQGFQDWRSPDGAPLQELPDPFTDANDDYAVLEWARTNPEGFGVQHNGEWMGWTTFMHMNEQEAHQYKIGNNARTALKVIDD